jgi:hypothetical protein
MHILQLFPDAQYHGIISSKGHHLYRGLLNVDKQTPMMAHPLHAHFERYAGMDCARVCGFVRHCYLLASGWHLVDAIEVDYSTLSSALTEYNRMRNWSIINHHSS